MIRFIFLFAFSLFLSYPNNNCFAQGSIAQNSSRWVGASLDSFFLELSDRGMFNGAVAVKKDGKLIIKKGYGIANFWYSNGFTSSTQIEVASISKQFTAAAIMILEQEEKLDIEDKAQKYLGSEFPYPAITIKHLLTHTSGLPDYEKYFRKYWDTSMIAYNNDILDYFKKQKPKLISLPGEKYYYSNSGYVMLAEVVKAASGKPLDEFLNEKIFLPAGMQNSGFYSRNTIWNMPDYAPGYMPDIKTCGYAKPEDLPGKYYYYFLSGRLGSGRLSSSVDDLIKWDSILYQKDILTEQSKGMIFKVNKPVKDTSDYGFGWHIYEDDELGKVVYHTGSWAGNLTFIKRYIDDKSLIVILNNTYDKGYMKEIREKIERYLKGEPLVVPKQRLEILLQKEMCNLSRSNLLSWYEDLIGNVVVDLKALESLKVEYRNANEPDKADITYELISLLKKTGRVAQNHKMIN